LATIVIDDHLLRDILAGERSPDLGGVAQDGIATTGLWLFRLCSSLAEPTVAGKLSSPVARLPSEMRARFRAQLVALPAEISVISLRELSWSMAELQYRHRAGGRPLSASMVEALAAAHRLDAEIAVSSRDVGPHLEAAAAVDRIAFHVL
jgi:hypothetical protein